MTLPTPQLDNRTAQQLVDELKQKIAEVFVVSDPETREQLVTWTDHNVSDPGIMLLELFAWVAEQIIFRLNQVPDVLYVKFLELLGVSLFPPVAARTDITFWISASTVADVVVPEETEVGSPTVSGQQPLVFMTDKDLRIVQPILGNCLTSMADYPGRYIDRWDELRNRGLPFNCFESEEISPGDAVYFGFDNSLASNVIELNFEIDKIAGIGIHPENPPLKWVVSTSKGWIDTTIRRGWDKTRGLNQSGPIMLAIPDGHEKMMLGSHHYYWIKCELIEPERGQAQYDRSPTLSYLEAESKGGWVPAHHGERRPKTSLGVSDGSANQQFRTPFTPVLSRKGREDEEMVVVVDPDGVETPWNEVDSFANSTGDDKDYTWDSTSGTITFGPQIRHPDGTTSEHGSTPPSGHEIVVTQYRVGGGDRGSVPPGTLTRMQSNLGFIHAVDNLDHATGGVDGETIDELKRRGPQWLRTGDRAVTTADFIRLTRQADQRLKRVDAVSDPENGHAINVYVIPEVETESTVLSASDLALSSDVFEQVKTYLDNRRILGTIVNVVPPKFIRVSVEAYVRPVPRASGPIDQETAAAIATELTAVLNEFVNPLVGGEHRDGWPWKTTLTDELVTERLKASGQVSTVTTVEFHIEDDGTDDYKKRVALSEVPLGTGEMFISGEHKVRVVR